MKALTSISTLLIFLLLTACSKKDFTLQFRLPEDISVNYSVTYYAADKRGGFTVQAVAAVQAGHCEVKGVTRLPVLIYISEKTRDIPLVVYAAAGDNIELSGESKQPLEWQVSGNNTNVLISEWRKEYADTLKRKKPEEINAAVADFIRSNPEEPAAAILLLSYYDRKLDEREYDALFASLHGAARSPELLKTIGRSDQLNTHVSYPAKLQSMVMKSALHHSDTLRPDSAGVVLMFFWQNTITNRRELLDKLSLLRKDFEDSARYLIADVNLDPDSTGWRSQIRKDTVQGIPRLWISAGLADRNILKLKVPSVPYFIVFDSLGSQIYRGNDVKDAIKEFRILAGENDSLTSADSKSP